MVVGPAQGQSAGKGLGNVGGGGGLLGAALHRGAV